jgi:hypothetical protein
MEEKRENGIIGEEVVPIIVTLYCDGLTRDDIILPVRPHPITNKFF